MTRSSDALPKRIHSIFQM